MPKFESMKKLLLVGLVLIPMACKDSETLGLLEYRVLSDKPGFAVNYTDDMLRVQEESVNDIVWFTNYTMLTGSAVSITALGNKQAQKLTAEIWYQGVKVATDTDSTDFPFVNLVAPL